MRRGAFALSGAALPSTPASAVLPPGPVHPCSASAPLPRGCSLPRWPPPLFFLFRATLATYGSSQARDLIGATPAGLHHSHRNAGSEPRQ